VYHSGEPGLFIAILRCWAHAATPGTILAGIDWVRNELATMMKGREATTDSERADSGHGPISVKLVLDAVAMRLLKIGEAVKSLSPELTESEPEIPWSRIAGMRDFLAHHYFATAPRSSRLSSTRTCNHSLTPFDAVARIRASLPSAL